MQNILPNGVYPPVPTFFDGQEELDLATLQRHIHHLVEGGIAGYVVMGTNGEAAHLSAEERERVIVTVREVLDSNISMPIIAGCGDQSTRSTIAHCRQAASSGASFALVLPPSYYRGLMSSKVLIAHYLAVADASPLPVLIYNMPTSSAGIDLDAETVCVLAQHPNIIGVKDSAGNIAKLAQIVANTPETFRVFAGSASYLLPALVVGAAGTVAALANIFPHEVSLVQALFESGELEEARVLQARLIPANAAVTTQYGVPGLKAALEITAGYGGLPRMPLHPLSGEAYQKLAEVLAAVPVEISEA